MIEERYFEYKKEKKIIDYADIVSDMEESERKNVKTASMKEKKR